MVCGLCLALSVYFTLLQPLYVISKTRLALAALIWALSSGALLGLQGSRICNTRGMRRGTVAGGAALSLIFSGLFLAAIFSLKELPYNLLLLPKQQLEITFTCSDAQPAEVKYFHNGLDIASYASFEKQGAWTRTQDSLRTEDCRGASLRYSGWLVESPYIVFRTQPGSGAVEVRWNGELQSAALDSEETGEVRVSQSFGYYPLNKAGVLAVLTIALATVLFPLGLTLARDLRGDDPQKRLEAWFNETSGQLFSLTKIMAAVSLLATAALFLTPLLARDRTAFTLDPSRTDPPPNIILIVADSLGAQDMSLFGYPLETTPNLARDTGDWTIYTNAQTMSTCTVRIFPSILSGRYPDFAYPLSRFGQLISAQPDRINLNQVLSDAGYQTWWLNYKPPGIYHAQTGIDRFMFSNHEGLMKTWYFMESVRIRRFPFYPYLLQKMDIQEPWLSSSKALERLGDMLAGGEPEAPFFIYMHYWGVHASSYNAGKYTGAFLPPEEGLIDYDEQIALLGAYPPEKQGEVDKLRLRYDEAILEEDYLLAELITRIKAAGIYDNSLIIITGDHGQVFDNGFTSHCTPLISYAETHVPLLIKYPGQKEGKREDALVSLIDLTPTILQTAGIRSEEAWFDGTALQALESQEQIHEAVYIRSDYTKYELYFPSTAVMNERYKLVQRHDGIYLYDYRNDPDEAHNLADDPALDPAILAGLKELLADEKQGGSRGD